MLPTITRVEHDPHASRLLGAAAPAAAVKASMRARRSHERRSLRRAKYVARSPPPAQRLFVLDPTLPVGKPRNLCGGRTPAELGHSGGGELSRGALSHLTRNLSSVLLGWTIVVFARRISSRSLSVLDLSSSRVGVPLQPDGTASARWLIGQRMESESLLAPAIPGRGRVGGFQWKQRPHRTDGAI